MLKKSGNMPGKWQMATLNFSWTAGHLKYARTPKCLILYLFLDLRARENTLATRKCLPLIACHNNAKMM